MMKERLLSQKEEALLLLPFWRRVIRRERSGSRCDDVAFDEMMVTR